MIDDRTNKRIKSIIPPNMVKYQNQESVLNSLSEVMSNEIKNGLKQQNLKY